MDSEKATPKRPSTKATTVSPQRSCAQPALPHIFTTLKKATAEALLDFLDFPHKKL